MKIAFLEIFKDEKATKVATVNQEKVDVPNMNYIMYKYLKLVERDTVHCAHSIYSDYCIACEEVGLPLCNMLEFLYAIERALLRMLDHGIILEVVYAPKYNSKYFEGFKNNNKPPQTGFYFVIVSYISHIQEMCREPYFDPVLLELIQYDN